MTNEIDGLAGSSSQRGAFTPSNSKNQELWYLCPPTVHTSAMVTGGLRNIYDDIRRRREAESSHQQVVDRLKSTTDDSGQFRPVEGMSLMAKRYEYVQTLAIGRTAVVIQAKDTFRNCKLVAIKILHDHNFLVGGQEADIYKQIQRTDLTGSIAIPPLLNVFRIDEHYCLVFCFYNPVPLNHHFRIQGWTREMSLQPIRTVASKMFRALDFLHKLNIIHADLKPENLLLDEEDAVGIIDFGNSIRCTPEEIRLYEEDFDLQTLNYRAPEVMLGVNIGPAVDLWSVGCIVAELYLGYPLFGGETQNQVLATMVSTLGCLPQEYLNGKYGRKYEHLIGPPATNADIAASLQQYLQCADANFINLLVGLFTYKSEDRMTALEALDCEFIKDI